MKRILVFVFISLYAKAIFDYDRAVGLAQRNEWTLAGERFKELVAADPDRPDMLYDAGVVAFNNEDFAQARTLFEVASEHEHAPRALKERAYFNKANTFVKEHDLKQALGAYEQVLMLNPDNEQAKHNAHVVKKMLEQEENQQKNEQQNQKNDQKDQENSQDRESNQESGKNDKNESGNSEKNSGDSRQNDDQQSGDEEKEEEESEQNQKRQEKGFNQNRNEQNKKSDGPKDQKSQSGNQEQGQRKRPKNEQSQQNEESKKREQIDHDKSPVDSKEMMEQAQEQDKSEGRKEQDSPHAGMQKVEIDPALERVLARREDRDAQLNKQIIKAHVGQTRDKYGNNW